MIAGLWRHRDLVDRVFSLADLFDAHEILDAKEANAAGYRQWREEREALNGN